MKFIDKITSRKFLLAVVGVVSGLAMAFGVEGTEITEVVSTVAGIVAALGSIVAYTAAEAKVDAAAAHTPVGVLLDETEAVETQ